MQTEKQANTATIVTHLNNPLDNKKATWAPEVVMRSIEMPLQKILADPKNFYAPQGLIQRILSRWTELRRNEYLHDLFSGAASKDLFIFADIDPVIENLKEELKEAEDKNIIESIKENLNYFQNLSNKGVKFLIIDGQHRIAEIKEFFNLNSYLPYKAPTESKLSKLSKVLNNITVDDKTFNMNRKSFNEFPENLRTELLNNIKITATIISSGNIRELKGLFRKANSGEPLSFFEILISDSYGSAWRYIMKFCNAQKQNEHVLNLVDKFHGFAGAFAPNKMGLEYTFSEMLLYIASNFGQDRSLPLKTDTKESLEVLFDFEFSELSKKRLDLHSEILTIIGNGTAPLIKKTKGIGRCDLVDLFLMISMLLDSKHPSRESGFPKFKINNSTALIDALFKMLIELKVEDRFLKDPETGELVVNIDLEGNEYPVKNPNSYAEHQRAVWDAGNLRHREGMMWKKFTTQYLDSLVMREVISKVGKAVTNQALKRQEVAVLRNWEDKYGKPLDVFNDVLGQNKSHDLSHKVHKSKGGLDTAENLEYEGISANRSKGAN